MSDSCVVYVNEALYYYFSFIFIYFSLTFFIIYLFYSFKVGTFDMASTQQISIQFERFIHIFKSNQSGIDFGTIAFSLRFSLNI